MPNTLQFRSLPVNSDGVSLGSVPSSWGYSKWVILATMIPVDIYIVALTFDVGYVGAADSTWEALFEIGFGKVSNPTTKAQIPYSFRNDTAVGYYMNTNTIFFPEPILAPALTTICVRHASPITAGQSTQKVKLLYQSNSQLVDTYDGISLNNYQSVSVGNGMSCGEKIR